jgi:signal peptidase I
MSIHIPAQRPAPDQVAAAAAPAPVAEPGWGGVLRTAAARGSLAMVLSLVIWSILPLLAGWTPQVILSGSMEPRIHSGDVIVTREVQPADLTKGQVITTIDPDSPEKTRTHRVLERDSAGKIVTKGDANREPDSTSVTNDAVLGLGVVRVPYVGRPVYWLAERNYGALGVTFLLLGWCVLSAFPGRVKPRDNDTDEDASSGPSSPSGSRRVLPVRSSRTNRRRRVAAAVAVSVVAVGAMGGSADAAFKQLAQNPASTLNAASTFYPYKTAVLADSPSFYWRLDEAGGTTVNDTGSGNRDGTLLAQTWTQGQSGALVSEPRNTSLALSVGVVNGNTNGAAPGTFSVEAWVKTTSTTGGRILGFGNGTGQSPSSTVDRQLYLAPNGKVMFGVGGSTKVGISSTAAINNGTWRHVVGTYTSGTNNMRLYVNGVLQGSATATPVAMSGIWRAGAEQLTGWPSNPTDFYYEGSLDELAVYPTALTAAKVLAHYNAGKNA